MSIMSENVCRGVLEYVWDHSCLNRWIINARFVHCNGRFQKAEILNAVSSMRNVWIRKQLNKRSFASRSQTMMNTVCIPVENTNRFSIILAYIFFEKMIIVNWSEYGINNFEYVFARLFKRKQNWMKPVRKRCRAQICFYHEMQKIESAPICSIMFE